MFLLPFMKYLRPHRMRLVVVFVCLFLSSFVSTYNLFMMIPALNVLFGEVSIEERQAEYREMLQDHREKLARLSKSDNAYERYQGHVKRLYYPLEEQVKRRLLQFYEYAADKRNKTKSLRLIVGIMVGLAIVNGLLVYGLNYNLTYVLYRMVITLRSRLFGNIMRQDMAFFSDHTVGFLMSRISSDVNAMRQVFSYIISSGVEQLVRLVFVLSALLLISVKLTGWAFVFTLPGAILLAIFARLIKKVARREKRRRDVLSSAMNESLQNVRLVKATATESLECDRFDKHNEKLFYYEMKRRVAKFASSPIMEFIGIAGSGAILLIGGKVVLSENLMEASTFLVYLMFLTQLYKPFKRLGRFNVTWQTSKVSAERIREMLQYQPRIVDPPEDLPPAEPRPLERGVEFQKVTFAYGDQVVLEDLDLTIEKGKTTAIVGRSGAGKTTVVGLLLRFFDPHRGTVAIDDTPLPHFRIADLRARFGVVTQETMLFNDTVRSNIAYGMGEIDDERVVAAARAAFAHDFIMALEGGNGYDTVVGPSGSRLSGGQRQRIAIARAFYRDPEILVLDEATSALDRESEAAIQAALAELMKRRTVVVVAHRLSTIMHADRIAVLDGGKLVEQGTHDELLRAGGHYATLYRHGEFDPNGDRAETATDTIPE